MCDKCDGFNAQIERYRKLGSQVTALTLEQIEQLISDTKAKIADLHPEQAP